MPSLPNRYFHMQTLALLLALVLPASAAGISENDLNAQKELLQLKIDSGKESLQKDIEALGKRFEAVDKRIDDQTSRVSDIGNAVDRFAVISGLLGILVTVILAAVGVFGYLSAATRARETASTVATDVATRTATHIAEDKAAEKAAQWIADNNTQLHKEIEEVRKAAQHAQQEIDELRNAAQQGKQDVSESVNDAKTNFKTQADAAIMQLQKSISAISLESAKPATPQSDSNTQALNKLAETFKNNPDAENDFEAWNTRAFAAYAAKNCEEASTCWQHAAQTPNANHLQTATSLFNAGAALGELKHHVEAIKFYDQLIARYASAPAPALREQVAKARHGKGVRFGRMQRNKEAIAIYDELIACYKTDSAPALREQVARAMFNKAIRLGEMQGSEEEIEAYDQLIAHYANNTDPAIKKILALAKNGKGFNRLMDAKQCWATNDQAQIFLQQAQTELRGALEGLPQSGMVLGNLAYIEYLLGNIQEAEHYLRSAMTTSEGGGQQLYESTLGDMALHPIEDDKRFKELVERLWAEYQA